MSADLPANPPANLPASTAAELYARISSDPELTQALFRQALQDPSGALNQIVAIGKAAGLEVSSDDVRRHISSLDDSASKQWLLKARGGL
ncbi:MAG: hypothetical protein R6W06_07460 [Prochlorococcaceae cyanobacterium]